MKTLGHWAGERDKRPAHAIATYAVTTAVDGPRTVYRAFLDFGFDLPSPESSVVVDPATAALAGAFQALDLPVPAAAISSGSPPVVTLDGPREVRRVAFSAAKSYVGSHVQLFRLDQQQRASQATVTAAVDGANGASGFGGFTDVRFAVAVQEGGPTGSEIAAITVRGAPIGGRLGILDPDEPGAVAFFWPTPDQAGTEVAAGAAFGKALAAYLEGKAGQVGPSGRLVIQADQPCRFVLTAFATGTSFAVDGFASPALVASDLTDAAGLAARIRSAADPVSAYLRGAIGQADLLDGLNAVIAGGDLYDAQRFAGVPLSPGSQAALATGGDPARLNRGLLEDAFPDAIAAPEAKRVLRFGTGGVAEAAVAIRLPAGATVASATVSTQESLQADRPAGGQAGAADAGSAGVHVGGNGPAAVGFALDAAVSATGIALPLVALTAGAELAVELQEDYRGAPSGKRLAAGTVTAGPPGTVRWASVFFDPVVLAAGTTWLVLRAARGEAVWLAAAAASGGMRVLRTRDEGPPVETVLNGLVPRYELFSRSGEALGRSATTLAVGGAPVAGRRLGEAVTYDLTAALAGSGAVAGGPIPLVFTASVAGTITVDPPHVEFDLPD